MQKQINQARYANMAKELVRLDPIILYTETTGGRKGDKVVQMAFVNLVGEVLLNVFVNPSRLLPPKATRIHGITDDMVVNSPNMLTLVPRIEGILRGRAFTSYNIDFDSRLLLQSLPKGDSFPRNRAFEHLLQDAWGHELCIMKIFAGYYGDWDEDREDVRYKRLDFATRVLGVSPPEPAH